MSGIDLKGIIELDKQMQQKDVEIAKLLIRIDGLNYSLEQAYKDIKELQEENKKLQFAVKDTKENADEIICELKEENDKLQDNIIKDRKFNENRLLDYIEYKRRIDKAIECINYYAIENSDYEKIYNIEEETLLNILGGKDE